MARLICGDVMRILWERNPNPAGRTRLADCRSIKFEALEDRRLLTATVGPAPHSYADWIPEAVAKAQDFLANHPTLTGDVESWFAEEDAAEAASGIKITLVELHLPQNVIPAHISIELVEEMMEELIEDRTPVHDVVEVIFNHAAVNEIDARLATRTQLAGATPAQPAARVAAAQASLQSANVDAAESQLVEEVSVSDQTIAVESTDEAEEIAVEVDASTSTAEVETAAFKIPIEDQANDDSSDDGGQALQPVEAGHLLLLPVPRSRPNFLAHLRADLQAVDASMAAMLEELQVLRRDIAEWLDEPPVSLWTKVGIGSVAMLAAWRELRRWRERRVQPDEEAVDWIFLHSLDHEGAAS